MHILPQRPSASFYSSFLFHACVHAGERIVDQIFIGQSVGYLGNAATNVVAPFTVVALALALLIGDGSAAPVEPDVGQWRP